MAKERIRKQIELHEYTRARKSVRGRLKRLRTTRDQWRDRVDSPIQSIGVFENEINSMEAILKGMQHRLDNAKITIEI